MIANLKPATIFLFVGISGAALTVALTAQHDGSKKAPNQQKLEEAIAHSSGTIEVEVTIQDQDGNALTDVEVEVAEVSPHGMFGTLTNRKTKTVDRQVHIRRQNVSSIECRFLKYGYYAERRSFSFEGEEVTPTEKVLSKTGVVVILRKKPEPAPLEKYEGSLRSNISGPTSVLYTRKLAPSDTPLTHEERNARSKLNLARPHIFLEPEINADGRLARVFVDIKGIGGIQTVLHRGYIKLSQTEQGDGFLVAFTSESQHDISRGFRRMTEAPEGGYSPDLQISADTEANSLFFYCRVHGSYGKGVVANLPQIVEIDGVESVGTRITLYLNPTNSRDVSYLHP
jgi:hypothetical protein